MRTYIVNLTNNLIGSYGFDKIYLAMKDTNRGWLDQFVCLVFTTISSNDVATWSPETLGKIVCSFEESECMMKSFPDMPAATNPQHFLRGLVSHFLATAILRRLDTDYRRCYAGTPPYVAKSATVDVEATPIS